MNEWVNEMYALYTVYIALKIKNYLAKIYLLSAIW